MVDSTSTISPRSRVPHVSISDVSSNTLLPTSRVPSLTESRKVSAASSPEKPVTIPKATMKQKMAAASINGDWIHMFCRNCTFTFGASGNIWKLFKRLGPEREVILNDDGKLATALYQCARIEDGKVVQQEIMKIYMQCVRQI